MKKLILTLLLLSKLCFNTQAKNDNYQEWSDLIENKSLMALLEYISKNETPDIPIVSSTYFISTMPPASQINQNQWLGLLIKLSLSIERDFPELVIGSNSSHEVIKIQSGLFKLASQLEKSGGYSNLVLANQIRNVQAYLATRYLLLNQYDLTTVREMLVYIYPPKISFIETANQLLNQDPKIEQQGSLIRNVDPDKDIMKQLLSLEPKDSSFGWFAEEDLPYITDTNKFKLLFQKPNVQMLILSQLQTFTLVSYNIEGTLYYLEKGGKFTYDNNSQARVLKRDSMKFKDSIIGVGGFSRIGFTKLFDYYNNPSNFLGFEYKVPTQIPLPDIQNNITNSTTKIEPPASHPQLPTPTNQTPKKVMPPPAIIEPEIPDEILGLSKRNLLSALMIAGAGLFSS